MKTKVLKFGLPMAVFMLAIVVAFATEKTTTESESLTVPGYIFENGQCKPARDCNNVAGAFCMQGSFQVYETNLGGTACITELSHRP